MKTSATSLDRHHGREHRAPAHLSRRGLLGCLGAGLAGALLGRQAVAAEGKPASARSCIVLWMQGGPSHLDTFDPKQKASGPAKARATKAPGVEISEHFEQLAEQMDKVMLIRGLTSKEGNHQRAKELAHTGHVPNPTVRAPSIGAWIAKERGPAGLDIPPFVSLGGQSHGSGFFGDAYDPFVVQRAGELPDDIAPARAIAEERIRARKALLARMDQAFAKRTGDKQVQARQELYARADRMMRSPATAAFDLSSEPEAVRQAYGDTDFGRGCLVARRLVERAVPFVEVTLDGWDTHEDNLERTTGLKRALDPAMASLLGDLAERGLLDTTLVVCMGEFGRSPRINGRDGRDHHPAAFSAALAGAGVRGGAVFGETDAEGAAVVKDPVTVPDLVATLAWRMGVDPDYVAWTPQGRPISVTEDGVVKKELFG